jgi:hypothetical protein
MKTAANAVKGHSCLLSCYIDGLSFPLMANVHYRGFCIKAQSLVRAWPHGHVEQPIWVI